MMARAGRLGLDGDVQRMKKIHGGPDRALCLFSLEVIEQFRAAGHPLVPGGAGENVTISGLDWPSLREGDQLHLGDVVIELTRTTDPCKQIAACFADKNPWHLEPRATTRWYARVLVEGDLSVGAVVTSPAHQPRSRG